MSDPDRLAVATPSTIRSIPSRARYVALGFTLLLTAIAYMDRVCLSKSSTLIKSDLQLTDDLMGYAFGVFTFAYALTEIPSGWLADRFGARLMLTRIVIWWSLMTAATGWVSGFASLFTVRLLFGIGEAGTFPSISCVYRQWLPKHQHSLAFGAAVMTGLLGGAVTQVLVGGMLTVMSWRYCFQIFGLVGLLWALLWFWWFRDQPRDHTKVNQSELELIGSTAAKPEKHPPVPWPALVRSRNLALLCLMYFGTIYGWYFYLTWLPEYFQRARGFDIKQTGWLASLPLIGVALGVMTGGWLSDFLQRRYGARTGRRLPGLVGLILAAASIIGVVMTSSPVVAVVMMSTAAALAALGVASAWALCIDIGKQHAGVVSGAMNMFGNFGGSLSPVVVGWCLKGWNSWNAPLYSIAFFYLVAAACWLGIDPDQPLENRVR